MKFAMAVINPHKLDEVRSALSDLSIRGMTVSEVKGFGRQKGHTKLYRGADYSVSMVSKVNLEIAVPSVLAERVVDTIQNSASTGRIGDGKIFDFEPQRAVRIRIGDINEEAL